MVFVITLSSTSNRIRVAKLEGTLEIVQVAPSVSNEEAEYQRETVTCQRSHRNCWNKDH